MAKIVISAPEEYKERWVLFCKSKNTKSSTMLKMMIDRVMGNTKLPINSVDLGAKRLKLDIRLNEEYAPLLDERAAAEGFPSRQSWATTYLLSQLKKEPVLTDKEIQELRASNRQLSAIGRNINQIAKALNMEKDSDQEINENLLKSIFNDIQEHKSLVVALVDRSQNKWAN